MAIAIGKLEEHVQGLVDDLRAQKFDADYTVHRASDEPFFRREGIMSTVVLTIHAPWAVELVFIANGHEPAYRRGEICGPDMKWSDMKYEAMQRIFRAKPGFIDELNAAVGADIKRFAERMGA